MNTLNAYPVETYTYLLDYSKPTYFAKSENVYTDHSILFTTWYFSGRDCHPTQCASFEIGAIPTCTAIPEIMIDSREVARVGQGIANVIIEQIY